jgi:AraC-like DNA-binding protein
MAEGTARAGWSATVSYAGNASGRNYDYWVEEICRGLVKVDVEPLGEGRLDWAMRMAELPDVRLGLFEGSAICFTAKQGDPAPRLYLQMPEAATAMCIVHGPRTLLLDANGAALADAAQREAQSMVLAAGRFRTFGIERKALLALCPDAEEKIVRPLAVDPELNSLMRQYHAFIMNSGATLDVEARAVLAQHIVDLTVLALGPGRDAGEIAKERGLAAARLAAIKKDIFENLSDPDLSVARVAARQRITPRYLHMIFSTEGISFTEFVAAQRLDRVHRRLCDPRLADHTISAIALRSGFGDLSYFNRTFRRRYGLTPSDVRERARREGGW